MIFRRDKLQDGNKPGAGRDCRRQLYEGLVWHSGRTARSWVGQGMWALLPCPALLRSALETKDGHRREATTGCIMATGHVHELWGLATGMSWDYTTVQGKCWEMLHVASVLGSAKLEWHPQLLGPRGGAATRHATPHMGAHICYPSTRAQVAPTPSAC